MDFSIPDPLQELITRYEAFLAEHVLPLERLVHQPGFKDALPQLEAARAEAKKQNLWAPHLPTEVGGLGLSLMEFAHISEVLGHSVLGHWSVGSQAPDVGNMELLMEFGTDAQKERWLGPLAAGELRSCFSMTEPEHAGSNPAWMSTSAVVADGQWVINGHKWYTSSADGAAFAIVMAVTDPDAEDRYGRASMILVPMDADGVELVRNISVMGDEGSDWMSHAEMRYTNVRVPEENLVGGRGAGFMLAQARLGPGRIHHCMRWIGLAERAMALSCQHAATREVAPGKPLGTRQTIQHWLAENRAAINGARLMVLQAAWKIDREGAYAAREEISLIKFHVAGVLQTVLDRAIQIHGGLGMSDDTPLAGMWRHERGARIYDGPDEVHKTVVARRMLRGFGLETRS